MDLPRRRPGTCRGTETGTVGRTRSKRGHNKEMAHNRIITAVICFLGLAGAAVGQDIMDKGIFAIYREGRPIGTEEFTISLLNGAGTIKSKNAFRMVQDAEPKDIVLKTNLALDANMVPKLYELTSEISFQRQSLKVEFKPRLAVCTFDLGTEKKTDAAILSADTIVLDDNVFCHWVMLLSRYDMKAKGTQSFNIFVPQQGKNGYGAIAVTFLGKESFSMGMGRSKGQHFRVQSPNLTVELWADEGRLLKIEVAANKAEVFRVE